MWPCPVTLMATTLIHTSPDSRVWQLPLQLPRWFLCTPLPPWSVWDLTQEYSAQCFSGASLLTQNKIPNPGQSLKGPGPSLWNSSWLPESISPLTCPPLHAGARQAPTPSLCMGQHPQRPTDHSPLTSCRSLLKHHSSERLSLSSLYEAHPPPPCSLVPSPCSTCPPPPYCSLHRCARLVCLSDTAPRMMQAVGGHIGFLGGFFPVLVTAVCQHLERNRCSGTICWRYKWKCTRSHSPNVNCSYVKRLCLHLGSTPAMKVGILSLHSTT